MAFIPKEVPSGVVDWANTVFNTQFPIVQIDDVFVDWVIYTWSISINWTEVTLWDAPTASIFIDYYSTSPIIPSDTLTVWEIKGLLKRHLNDELPNVDEALFLDWINALNRFTYRHLYKLDSERFLQEETYNVTEWTSQYSNPALIETLAVIWWGVFKTDANGGLTDDPLIRTNPWSSKLWYYTWWTVINFTPTPVKSDTYIMRYVPKIGRLDSDDDVTVIPSEYERYARVALQVTYYDFVRNQNEEVFNDQKLERELDELLDNYRQEHYILELLESNNYY